jgi:hypothetical protein
MSNSDEDREYVREDPVAKWRREANEWEARVKAAHAEPKLDTAPFDWPGYIETRIHEAIEAQHQHTTALLAHLIADIQDEVAEQISSMIDKAYAKAFADVRLDLATLRHELSKLSGGSTGTVIDLPNPLSARRTH